MNRGNGKGAYNLLKSRAEMSNINPVPSYRAYGVTKKENVFTHLNEILAILLGWVIYIPYFFVIIVGTLFMIKLGGNTGIVFASFVGLLFVYFVLARNIRKRAKFIRKLRKQCRKFGYAFELKRSFLKGLRFNKKGIDLIVHTPYKRWYVRFMTPKRHRSHITILSKTEIEIKTNVTRNAIKAVLGLGNMKTKYVDYSFDEEFKSDRMDTQKVLLVNPVPLDMFKRDRDGARIPIGTGEKIYDYIMYSGSGFINALDREYNENKTRGRF